MTFWSTERHGAQQTCTSRNARTWASDKPAGRLTVTFSKLAVVPDGLAARTLETESTVSSPGP